MKTLLSILGAVLFICASTFAQEQTSGFDRSKLFFGGSLGLSFSSNYTIVKIAPQVGYQFNPYFAAGGGVGYNYFGYSDHFSSWSLNYLGLNAFGRVTPTKYVALQIQPEIYRMWGSHLSESRIVPCVLVGGGIILPTGTRGGVSVMLYYDLAQDRDSPYNETVIYSVGYVFNF